MDVQKDIFIKIEARYSEGGMGVVARRDERGENRVGYGTGMRGRHS